MTQSISLNQLIMVFSKTIDLLDHKLHKHHWNVAYISMMIAKEIPCSEEEVGRIIIASLLHDIGVFKCSDRKKLLDYKEIETVGHEEIGAIMLEKSSALSYLSPIVRDHHLAYKDWKPDTPREAGIIYLADRISVLLDFNRPINELIRDIKEKLLEEAGERFNPLFIDAFLRVAKHKAFWLDLQLDKIEDRIVENLKYDVVVTSFEDLLSLGNLFIQAVDFRSRYTAAHSYGVSKTARAIGELLNLNKDDLEKLELAGFYHDIGKIAIPKEVLDKPGKLTELEKDIILGHSYFTYDILSKLDGMKDLAHVAAYHHECLDGSGYPFGVSEENLDTMSCIIAIADIFTAITENRPYRSQMRQEKCQEILVKKAERNKIDASITKLVLDNYSYLYGINVEYQKEAYHKFQLFEDEVFKRTGYRIN